MYGIIYIYISLLNHYMMFNRALLKRIGKILTAPPTIGEDSSCMAKRVEFGTFIDYIEMKV